MSEQKMTAHNPSVGADDGQSTKSNNNIIPDFLDDFNTPAQNYDAWDVLDESYLKTISMPELYDTVFGSRPPLIDGLLYSGVYLFAGAPKVGKSFLMAQLAYHVSLGISLWGYEVRKSTVLYLALEDDYHRLQSRLYRMFGTDSADNLYFSTYANSISEGLDKQLKGFISEHPDTKLVIIDTLQKIREVGGDGYSYANDYQIIAQLKEFAGAYGLCLLLVHHTRKQQADDKFDMISGTNGLLGAADGAFLLHKEKRTSNSAILEISGRDQQDQKLYLTRNIERLTWELEKRETELWKEPKDPLLEVVAQFITADNAEWCGTPTELVAVLGVDMKANALSMKLNINAGRLFNEYGICYENKRSHDGRRIKLSLAQA